MTELKKSENSILIDMTSDDVEKIEIDTDNFNIILTKADKQTIQLDFPESAFFSLINFFKE